MKRLFLSLLSLISIACIAQPFTPGNFVALRIGSGSAAMAIGVAQPVFLDEYTPAGTLVRSIPMPIVTTGSNRKLTLPISLTDFSEGYLSLSPDRQNLILGGYDEVPGADTVSTSLSTSIRRVVGIVNASATVNTSTALNTFSKVTIRAATANGNDIWVSGGNGGIMYTTLGSATQTVVSTSTGRCLEIFGGQLYATSPATGIRIATIGTGLPTTTNQTLNHFMGYPTDGSPYQFFLADLSITEPGLDVLYITDNNLLRKFSKVSGTWVSNGTIGVSTDRYRGLTARVENNNVILFSSRKNDNTLNIGGEIVRLTDSAGYNASFSNSVPTVIVTAAPNTVIRGLAFAPTTPLITLPVTLSTFNGNYIEKQIQLHWTTASEVNNSHFVIQHSADGINFTNLGAIAGNGNTSRPTSYQFNHSQPVIGKNYYRLKQVDRDGNSRLSSIILVHAKENVAAFKARLISSSVVEINTNTDQVSKGTVAIIDANGKIITTKTVDLLAGSSRIAIEVPHLSSGVYMAALFMENGLKLTDKFIK